MTLGSAGNSSLYINDSGTWKEFISYEYFKVIRKQNQISEFEIKIYDIGSTEKSYVKEFADVLFLSENNLILKGRIQKVTYETSYSCIITGFGMESKLLDKELIKSNDKRVQYTNESAQTVAKEILSSNTDGVTPWIVEPNTTGLFDVDYGNISIRYEYGNRLNSLAKLAETIDYEWSVSQGDDYNDDYFNMSTLLPTSTRATVSQETFEITGVDANCYLTSKEVDITNLANKVDTLGYGDGINQLHTSTYSASETYSTLASDITDSSVTITLADATDFDSSGEIRIAEERITYTGKSGNDLTGCARGANSTTALVHKQNVYIEKYVAITSPESGSSIGANGLMDYTITERDIIDLSTLELIGSRILLERMDPIVRIIVMPNEPLETIGSRKVGDKITINDSESGISGEYRIVGMTCVSDYGDLSLEIEASNKTLNFIEQMQKQKQIAENLSKYMQGATNIYAISSYDNSDDTHPLNLRFWLPNEAIAVNSIKLNFKLKDFRGYVTSSASNTEGSYSISSIFDSESIATPPFTFDIVDNINASGVFLNHNMTFSITNLSGASHDYKFRFESPIGTPLKDYNTQTIADHASHVWGHIESSDLRGNTFRGVLSNASGETYALWTGDDISMGVSTNIASFGIHEETLSSPLVGIVVGTEDEERTLSQSDNGTAEVGSDTTLQDTDKSWVVDEYKDYLVNIYDGTGAGQQRIITSNTSNTLTVSLDWDTNPDNTSVYEIAPTYSTDQDDLDITSNVSGVGVGNWVNVKCVLNKRMRIEANIYCQIFIESK